MNKQFQERSKTVFDALCILAKIDGKIIFLGGSAIQAILEKPKRLSIDLDVSYSGEVQKLVEGLLQAGYEVKLRESKNPSFLFYNLFKNNVLVKLDVSKFIIPETEARKIQGIEILFPKQSYFLASKLSTLAFGTIGRFVQEPTQITKDVFDINCLLDEKPGLEKTARDWKQITTDENKLRNTSFTEKQCLESVEKTLLKCVQATPPFNIPQNALGSFQDTLLTEKITRSDLATMSARAILLLACMNNGFYEAEKQALTESQDAKKLALAEKALLEKNLLEPQQLHALKLTAPKALAFLKHYSEKRGLAEFA